MLAEQCRLKLLSAWVFSDSTEPMKQPGPGEWFDQAVNHCVKDGRFSVRVTLHDLRHTAASLMVASGANVKVVQRQLGHASATR
nr:tyrosine-type recombinase/integrase [Corynebacterium pseudopelargi]